MVSKIVNIGSKVEFTKVQSAQSNESSDLRKTVYASQVYDVIDETKIKVAMPIENGHVVALSPNTRLDASFYTPKGLYHGRVVVTDRMKEGNLYVMVVELQSELQKFQRRQYYRLSCTIDLSYRAMEKAEHSVYIATKELPDVSEIEGMVEGYVLDFSGGGVRFISDKKYERNQLMYIKLNISYEDTYKVYFLAGKVILSSERKNGMGRYENRVEFINLENKAREEIIKYIFREERRQRKLESDIR